MTLSFEIDCHSSLPSLRFLIPRNCNCLCQPDMLDIRCSVTLQDSQGIFTICLETTHMKLYLVLCAVCASLVLQSDSVFAGDGTVPAKTLYEFGLGDMELLSDQEGAQIRGRSANAFARGASTVSGILFDPATGSFVVGFDGNAVIASAESAGAHISIQSSTNHQSGVGLSLAITTSASIRFPSSSWTPVT